MRTLPVVAGKARLGILLALPLMAHLAGCAPREATAQALQASVSAAEVDTLVAQVRRLAEQNGVRPLPDRRPYGPPWHCLVGRSRSTGFSAGTGTSRA